MLLPGSPSDAESKGNAARKVTSKSGVVPDFATTDGVATASNVEHPYDRSLSGDLCAGFCRAAARMHSARLAPNAARGRSCNQCLSPNPGTLRALVWSSSAHFCRLLV